MKKLLLICALLSAFANFSLARDKARHVIFIGLDGWGSYSYEKADMPNVKRLAENGAYTLRKRCILPTVSATNWATIFMGAGVELHGVHRGRWQSPTFAPRKLGRNNIFPTIFQIVRDKKPNAEMGCMYDWYGIMTVVDTLSLNYHALSPNYEKFPGLLCDMAEKYIKEKKPTFAAIIFDEPDHNAHENGHGSAEMYKTLKRMDDYVGRIIKAVEEAGMLDDTIFVITSDHGGIDKTHGGYTMEELETPFIISGKNVKKGYCFDDISMMQQDVSPTIAEIFHAKCPQVWTGRPIKEVFK